MVISRICYLFPMCVLSCFLSAVEAAGLQLGICELEIAFPSLPRATLLLCLSFYHGMWVEIINAPSKSCLLKNWVCRSLHFVLLSCRLTLTIRVGSQLQPRRWGQYSKGMSENKMEGLWAQCDSLEQDCLPILLHLPPLNVTWESYKLLPYLTYCILGGLLL